MKIKHERFGDAKTYPVINSIVNIFNETIDDKTFKKRDLKYCLNTLQEFNTLHSKLNSLDKKSRFYYMTLLKNDFIKRINLSILPDALKTHMDNLIISIHRNKVRIFIERKKF